MTCTESFAAGSQKPRLLEKFPSRATAGHLVTLELEVEHLPGEQVLPAGPRIQPDSPEAKELLGASFQWPDAESAVQPSLQRVEREGKTLTLVRLPFLALPNAPGRVELTLPPLPISIARASGKLEQLCTVPHPLTVEDALVQKPSAALAPDPEPRPQLEIWWTARDVTLGLLLALPLLLLLLWAARRVRSRLAGRKKPVRAVPPWESALAALSELERERLLEREQFEAYLDRVSDTLREYLGRRYGFDGLESTTRETLRQLGDRARGFEFEREVRTILQRSDLVKFARRLPELEECRDAMTNTRQIVQRTIPAPTLDPRSQQPAADNATGAT